MTKTIEQARRKAFEAKYPVPYYITWNVDRNGYYSIHRDSTRKRGAENYDAKWQGYNAALDILCIALPDQRTRPDGWAFSPLLDDGFNHCLELCREAIHAAGVKTR